MKKIFTIVLFTVIAVLTFCGCEKGNTNKVDYDMLTQKLSVDYSGWTLTVTTKKDDVTLTDKFTVKNDSVQTEIEYTIETLGELSFDNDSEFITRKSGNAVIKDGKVQTINGDEVSLDIEKLTNIGLTFKAEYFSNAVFSDTSFSATVIKPSDFMGEQLSCTNMAVSSTFEAKFSQINITYTSDNGAKIVCNYSFAG